VLSRQNFGLEIAQLNELNTVLLSAAAAAAAKIGGSEGTIESLLQQEHSQ
jgi:hypothetical protein